MVGPVEALHQKSITAQGVNWVSGETPTQPVRAEVKIRYKADFRTATITPLEGDRVQIEFDKAVRDASPGQFAVFYDGEVALGGGEIV